MNNSPSLLTWVAAIGLLCAVAFLSCIYGVSSLLRRAAILFMTAADTWELAMRFARLRQGEYRKQWGIEDEDIRIEQRNLLR